MALSELHGGCRQSCFLGADGLVGDKLLCRIRASAPCLPMTQASRTTKKEAFGGGGWFRGRHIVKVMPVHKLTVHRDAECYQQCARSLQGTSHTDISVLSAHTPLATTTSARSSTRREYRQGLYVHVFDSRTDSPSQQQRNNDNEWWAVGRPNTFL